MPNYSIPQSALNTLDVVMQTTANNIANMNTDGFISRRVTLSGGPYQDEGVQVGAIRQDMNLGPAVVNHIHSAAGALGAYLEEGIQAQALNHDMRMVNNARNVTLVNGPNQDETLQMSAMYRDMQPEPVLINHLTQNDVHDFNDTAAVGMRNSRENYDTTVAQDVEITQRANAADAWRIQDYREGQNSLARIQGMAEGSTTDLPREFTIMIMTENAYSANAAAIRAWDELTGSLLNVKV